MKERKEQPAMTPREIERYELDKQMCDQLRPIRKSVAMRAGVRSTTWFSKKSPRNLSHTRETVAWIAREKIGMRFELISVVCGWSNPASASNAYDRVLRSPERIAECERLYELCKGAA